MSEDLRPPYRIQFDNAKDPYTARNALGITDISPDFITSVTAPLSVTGGDLSIDLSGYGNVSNSGTPTSGQYGKWVTATTIQGVAPATVLSDIGAASTTDFPAGAWTTWSLTVTASAGTITSTTTNTARYTKHGKTVTAYIDITITNAGTGAGFLIITLPVTSAASGGGFGSGREIVGTGSMVQATVGPAATLLGWIKYDNTTFIATNNRINAGFVYEGA